MILTLAVPMGVAALMINVGTGPTTERVAEDFTHEDVETRKNALKWMTKLRRTMLYELVLPALDDPNSRNREHALGVLEKMKNPDSLPHLKNVLDRAIEKGDWDEADSALGAMDNIGYPQVLPYLWPYLEHPNKDFRYEVGESVLDLRKSLNKEVCFYSVGDKIYNELGHVIYSQAEMFPPGEEDVEEGPNIPNEVRFF